MLAVVATTGMVLTGCSNKPERVAVEVEATEETQTEETTTEAESTTEAEETVDLEVEETEEATDTIDASAVTEDGEVVAEEQLEVGDYLTEHGLTVTPQGTHLMTVADSEDADTTHGRTFDIKVETVPADVEGYSDTILTAKIDVSKDIYFNSTFGAYDRYTGINLAEIAGKRESTQYNEEGGSDTYNNVVEVDGIKFDITYTMTSDTTSDPNNWIVTQTVRHPSEYDGVVFRVGKKTASQIAFECDHEAGKFDCRLASHPEYLEDRLLFTASDK